ncbi:MAG: 5-deoxy-glucuronate isomerase, partial [Clostridia bacterium]
LRTENPCGFASHLYLPEETEDEHRGAGLMNETSTRIVRTIFDYHNAPDAKLVLGEVIGFPGKWSSYPPHHHPQPEIYYYKTCPPQGFAYAELGENVVKVHENDVVCIAPGLTHPHCTAPGYALWYLWAIRHLEGNPYITPTFLTEHQWVLDADAVYWPQRKGGEA